MWGHFAGLLVAGILVSAFTFGIASVFFWLIPPFLCNRQYRERLAERGYALAMNAGVE